MSDLTKASGGDEKNLAANIAELLRGYPQIVAHVVRANPNARVAAAAVFEELSVDVRKAFAAAVRLVVSREEYHEHIKLMAAAVKEVLGVDPMPLSAAAADTAAKKALPPTPPISWRSATEKWESIGMGVRLENLIHYICQFPELRARLESSTRIIGLKVFIDAAMATKVGPGRYRSPRHSLPCDSRTFARHDLGCRLTHEARIHSELR